MNQQFNRFRSSDDSAQQRDIRRTNQPKSPLDYLDLATRHEIFFRKVDQGGPAESVPEEHQELIDLKKTVEKHTKDMHALQKDYTKAHAYYETHKNNPNNPNIDDHYLCGFVVERAQSLKRDMSLS